jgi:hypothetical protein
LIIQPLQEGLTWFGPYSQRKVQQRAADSEVLLKELNEGLKSSDPAVIREKMEEFRKRMGETQEQTIVLPPTWYVFFLQLLPFLAFTQHLFFLLFLRSLCVSFRDQELADQCVKLLIAEGALLVVAFLVGLIPQLMLRSGNLSTIRTVGTFITIFQWLITLASLGILTWYFYVLMCARALVPDRSGESRPRRRRRRSA